MIPQLIDNTLKIAVDPLFPCTNWNKSKHLLPGNSLFGNKFELIFDELIEGSLMDQADCRVIYSTDEEEEDEF